MGNLEAKDLCRLWQQAMGHTQNGPGLKCLFLLIYDFYRISGFYGFTLQNINVSTLGGRL